MLLCRGAKVCCKLEGGPVGRPDFQLSIPPSGPPIEGSPGPGPPEVMLGMAFSVDDEVDSEEAVVAADPGLIRSSGVVVAEELDPTLFPALDPTPCPPDPVAAWFPFGTGGEVEVLSGELASCRLATAAEDPFDLDALYI